MKVSVCDYLLKKLELLGIKTIFGLPGDYNFNILDSIIESNLNLVNCTNELNAAYAADGYARIEGFGAVVTTYGVGELSAINGVAGAFAENVPLIHITGVPRTSYIENKVLAHHNFYNPDYYVFERVYKNVVQTTAYLTKENAKDEINRIIDTMVNEKLPVYIAIPIDICDYEIDDGGFEIIKREKSDEKNLENAYLKIENLLKNSKKPLICTDYLVKRFNLREKVSDFSKRNNINIITTPAGKGSINEDEAAFKGTTLGEHSSHFVKEAIKNADFLMTFSFLNSDLNTGGFNAFLGKTPQVKIERNRTIVLDEVIENVLIEDIINLLSERFFNKKEDFCALNEEIPPLKETGEIEICDILPKVQSIFEPNDIFMVETGILGLSSGFLKLKKGMEYLTQALWGSIGWATPASFGAFRAKEDLKRKGDLILFTGDGSHQLTIQEMANYFNFDYKPVIFVLNNFGYSIEKVLSGKPDAEYNKITNWDYQKLINALSEGKDYFTKKVKTNEKFLEAIDEIKKNKGKKLCYIEIISNKDDVTKLSLDFASTMKKFTETLIR